MQDAKPGRDHAENARRLAKVSLDGNRRLLARLPIEPGEDGTPTLVRQTREGRCALRLEGKARADPLTQLLADDPHFAEYLKIPVLYDAPGSERMDGAFTVFGDLLQRG
ncbi:uncharacterized protein DUF3616 [Pseudorhodoferax soli]|uniref:Uncharacterized protein DUF3616 n=1 Tax=Pseudorhodoferax soli TaxID=545864 RepID=A0A368XRU4_9BURK|nr:DUF3616 domain-containing protein [Pseudorhodoferax soli]RCW69267.1 uncharacterized protein DUF3616 [Pseudorhodoferax soli]